MALNKLHEKALRVLQTLKTTYPEAKIALEFTTPLELLVATILSAQCTDARVNLVTKGLFKKYVKLKDYAQADLGELASDIRSTGFYKNKAKNIIGACRQIAEQHGGRLPRAIEELTQLPGVGRKTANVLLGNAFNIPGITVDTHVLRLSNRIGFASGKDPVKVELALNEIIPQSEWTMFSHYMQSHGRQICQARKPRCRECPILEDCASPQID